MKETVLEDALAGELVDGADLGVELGGGDLGGELGDVGGDDEHDGEPPDEDDDAAGDGGGVDGVALLQQPRHRKEQAVAPVELPERQLLLPVEQLPVPRPPPIPPLSSLARGGGRKGRGGEERRTG